MKPLLYRNCAGCGRLFADTKLKRIGKVNQRERWCPSCLARERIKRHLARIEELQGT